VKYAFHLETRSAGAVVARVEVEVASFVIAYAATEAAGLALERMGAPAMRVVDVTRDEEDVNQLAIPLEGGTVAPLSDRNSHTCRTDSPG